MTQYIDKDTLVAEIKARISDIEVSQKAGMIKKRDADTKILLFKSVLLLIDTLEVKEVDLEKESELIANGIMISVQSNKYGTNIYNTERNDFNHYHLQMAARKGIELGLNVRKGE